MYSDPSGLEAVSYLIEHGPRSRPPTGCDCTMRWPDYVHFRLIFTLSLRTLHTQEMGTFSPGRGFNRGYPNPVSYGASITDGWLLKCDPTPAELNNFRGW